MNIFVAGVHGVGKTYLASLLPATIGLMHASASKLIHEERTMSNWGADKQVGDVNANQIALAAAVRRYNSAGTRLLLDGHFVLLNAQNGFTRLETDIFRPLKLDSVVLLEAEPHIVATRICERDGREVDINHLVEFIAAERSQAQMVCDELRIPLLTLKAPTPAIFAEAITVTIRKTEQ